jgi:ribose transport system permease protein
MSLSEPAVEKTIPTAVAEKTTSKSRARGLFGNQQFILLLVWFAMIALFTYLNHIFFSVEVAGNILSDWSPVVLLATGETFVVISGGIDLSVGAVLGFSGVIGAYVMQWMTTNKFEAPITLAAGLVTCALVGLGVGLINALLINKARLVPFIATLATLGAAGGMSIVLTGGGPIAGGPPTAISLSVPWLGPFSTPTLVTIGVVILCGLFLHLARFGRYTYAIGSNAFAARAAGINVQRQITKIYALSGLLAGLAGMYLYLRLGSGSPTSGQGAELDAIAAVVIGGAALSGGEGRITGTVLGAFILTTVTSGLIIIGVAPNWKQVVVAVLIAGAVSIQQLRRSSGRAA